MIFNENIALTTAELLLKIKAVKLSPKNLFTWASGIKSPIYTDNRITLSYPEIRTFIRQNFVAAIEKNNWEPELIVGVATGGIPQGALVAQELALPFAYVRSSKKEHGLTNQIEGEVRSGQRAVIIEDLISTGSSSLGAVSALKGVGCQVKGMLAIFTYNLSIAQSSFQKENCPLITLTDFDYLVKKAFNINYITEEDLIVLGEFKKSLENK
ncbi:MAG: orotate phosphoribosyltransferase [Bacteroidetes bacterium]|nr:orotate phosphoribosyltransferase [Bacteroidota bacterium]